jgi:hypothetical protein
MARTFPSSFTILTADVKIGFPDVTGADSASMGVDEAKSIPPIDTRNSEPSTNVINIVFLMGILAFPPMFSSVEKKRENSIHATIFP